MSCSLPHNPIVVHAVQCHSANELRQRESIDFLSCHFNARTLNNAHHINIREWKFHWFVYYISRFLFRASLRLIHWYTIVDCVCDGNALIANIHRNFLGGNVLNCNALKCGVEIIYYRKKNGKSTFEFARIQCILIAKMETRMKCAEKLKCTRLYLSILL